MLPPMMAWSQTVKKHLLDWYLWYVSALSYVVHFVLKTRLLAKMEEKRTPIVFL
jgi:hypothetical protein